MGVDLEDTRLNDSVGSHTVRAAEMMRVCRRPGEHVGCLRSRFGDVTSARPHVFGYLRPPSLRSPSPAGTRAPPWGRSSSPVCKQSYVIVPLEMINGRRLTMGISRTSTSAHCEKPQCQTSPSKSFCVTETRRGMKTGMRDGAAVWAKEDNEACKPQIEIG